MHNAYSTSKNGRTNLHMKKKGNKPWVPTGIKSGVWQVKWGRVKRAARARLNLPNICKANRNTLTLYSQLEGLSSTRFNQTSHRILSTEDGELDKRQEMVDPINCILLALAVFSPLHISKNPTSASLELDCWGRAVTPAHLYHATPKACAMWHLHVAHFSSFLLLPFSFYMDHYDFTSVR